MIALLSAREDPRLDEVLHRLHRGRSTAPTDLNIPGKPDYDQPFVTCAETQFIIAEAALHAGDDRAAQTAYEAGLACQESAWGVSIQPRLPLTLEEVMTAKYIALFLNPEIWNDYKRTCYPQVVPPTEAVRLDGRPAGAAGALLPASRSGRRTRTSRTNDETVLRNANDPQPCVYPGVG